MSDDDDRLFYAEWSSAPGFDPNDPRAVADANPAYGGRLSATFVDVERQALDEAELFRERYGIWDELLDVLDASPISAKAWEQLTDPRSSIATGLSCAVDVSPDRTAAAVVFAGIRADGLKHVELAAHGRGTTWVLDYLIQRHRRWRMPIRVVPASPAGSLIEDLEAAGVDVALVDAREYQQACGALLDLVEGAGVRHRGQVELTSAVAAGRRHDVGESFRWRRKDTTSDITPLVAATVALHGAGAAGGPQIFVFT